MYTRLKHAYIGLSFGFATGLLAWMTAAVIIGPGGWAFFFGTLCLFMLIEGLIGLLLPEKAWGFFTGLLRGMLGDESP